MDDHDLEANLQTLKELWLTESDLSFLHELEPDHLARITREVRAHAARVHEDQRKLFETMAKATRFIPNFVLAKLSHGMSGYVLAKITEYLDVKSAATLAKLYEPALLAEIATHLRADMAAGVAAQLDLETLTTIIDVLSRKGLVRRLGELSDALDERLLERLVRRIGDAERIAAVASHMTALEKLVSVARRLDTALLHAIVQTLHRQGHESRAQLLAR